MSLKGSRTTADYVDYEKLMFQAEKLLQDKKTRVIGTYIIVAINTGLRCGDILKLTVEDLKNDTVTLQEQKTKKHKIIAINENIKNLVRKIGIHSGSPFISQKGSVISIQHLNQELKKHIKVKGLNISSHSLRKSFGRRVFQQNNESELALVYLSEIFNHSSILMTKIYLGIRQQELNNVYLNL
jgi:integrase